MKPHQLEETAVTGSRPGPADAPTEAVPPPPAEATFGGDSSPTDATVVRSTPSSPTVPSLGDLAQPGTFGRYELLGELARGGMGVVYRARQHGLDRVVALKMILGTGGGHDAAQRFLQEARAAAALDHPNVVPIYDTGEIDGRPYFTMALVEGPNLRGYVEARGLLPIPVAVSLFAQIVAGVAHAHRHGIIHRDLKPANVLVDKDGRPRVTDFGLAKRAAADTQLTATGQVVGTPQYMAPEQARESKDVGPPADVYSLGTILYFLLTGRAPFHGDSVADVLVKVLCEEPESPRAARPEVPEVVEALCLRCLAKKPEDRFADANALLAALAPMTGDSLANLTPTLGSVPFPPPRSTPSLASATEADPSHPARPAPVIAPPAGRKPLLLGALLAVALLLAAATVAAVIASRGGKSDGTAEGPPNPSPVTPGAPGSPPVSQPAAVEWPAPTRDDFGLTVHLDAPGKQEQDGTIRLRAGTPMSIRVTADRDCHVTVWLLEPTGEIQKLFPNDDDTDDHFEAGKERVLPSNDAYIMDTIPTAGPGVERLRVLATTGARPAYPAGTKNGRYVLYANRGQREELASTVRGIVLKKTGAAQPAVSERELRFRVSK